MSALFSCSFPNPPLLTSDRRGAGLGGPRELAVMAPATLQTVRRQKRATTTIKCTVSFPEL